jgi:hypothetical protein
VSTSDTKRLARRHITADAEPEEPVWLLCLTTDAERHFDDDVETVCADCGVTIFHRPHIPPAITKLCPTCALQRVTAEDGEVGDA